MSVNWQAIDYDTNIKIYITSIKQKSREKNDSWTKVKNNFHKYSIVELIS